MSVQPLSFLDQAKEMCTYVHDFVETPHRYRDITNTDLPPLSDIRATGHAIGNTKAYKLYLLLAETDRIRRACEVATLILERKSADYCIENAIPIFPEENRSLEKPLIIDKISECKDGSLSDQIQKLATARLKIGDAPETSLMSWVYASAFSSSMRIRVASIKNKNISNSYYFVILHPSAKVIEDLNKTIQFRSKRDKGRYATIDVLNNLPRDCVILDAVLKICCLAKNLNTEGQSLIKYIKNNDLRYPLSCALLKKQEKVPCLLSATDLVVKSVSSYLDKFEYSNDMLLLEFAREYSDSSLQALQEAFPGTTWKSKIDNTKLSFASTCNQEQLEQISKTFESKSISFQKISIKEGRYLVSIPDAYCIFKKKPTQDIEPSS